MRFIGNKENLVDWIYSVIEKKGIEGNRFFDFFSGTTNVGRYFKSREYEIISSDLLYSSFVIQKAYLENNIFPKFKKLLEILKIETKSLFNNELDIVFEYLNNLKGVDGFIYQNYTPGGTYNLERPRKYFIDENGRKIDAIRKQIEQWHVDKLISENEYFILLAGLIESVPFYSNILGVYAAFKKDWDTRAMKPFELKPIRLITSNQKHIAHNLDSMELLEKYNYDIIYLDPPYYQRQYAPNYHILETIAKYDNPVIKGVTGMRDYKAQKSNFCITNKALIELEKILQSDKYKYLILSYNNEGIMPQSQIINTMKKYGVLEIKEYDYLRFKSNNNGKSKTKKYIKEQLYILTRSPLHKKNLA